MRAVGVSEINRKIKSLLEEYLMLVRVEGEIASVTYHTSGHIYFSIKDDKSTLKCVMWRSNAAKLRFTLKKGDHIVIDGSIGVYTPRGEYQLIAASIEPYGRGSLAAAFEELKAKLKQKGYFDPERKKSIPDFPRLIALVTAAGGAALQDMLKVAGKRWGLCDFIVVDTLVQGRRAACEIAKGIEYADRLGADLIVVGRGGGSAEDLWAFNEEEVADAIFEAETPVVSAVGHEVDLLISDMVADLRAPTPSAAMEMVLPDKNEMLYLLEETEHRLNTAVGQILSRKSDRLSQESRLLQNSSVTARLERISEAFDRMNAELGSTMRMVLGRMESRITPLETEMRGRVASLLADKHSRLDALSGALKLNDPASRRMEGWAEVSIDARRVSLADLKEGDIFSLYDGGTRLKARCLEISHADKAR